MSEKVEEYLFIYLFRAELINSKNSAHVFGNFNLKLGSIFILISSHSNFYAYNQQSKVCLIYSH